MRRVAIVLAALFVTFFAYEHGALAIRFGGSFGGRGGFSRSFGRGLFRGTSGLSRSFGPRSYGHGVGRGYGGTGGFLFFFGSEAGSMVFAAGTLLALSVGMLILFMIKSRLEMRKYMLEGSDQQDYTDEAAGMLTEGERLAVFARLSVAYLATEKQLQKALMELAGSGKVGTPEGEAYLLRETCLAMVRGKDAISRFFFDQKLGIGETRARSLLDDASMELRSKFDRERIRADSRGTRRDAGQAVDDLTKVAEFLVVSLAVAYRPPALVQRDVLDVDGLAELIKEIGSLGPERLLGMEVVWDPATPQEVLTEEELDRDYPELLPV